MKNPGFSLLCLFATKGCPGQEKKNKIKHPNFSLKDQVLLLFPQRASIECDGIKVLPWC